MAIGTHCDGAMLGGTEGSMLSCCSASSVPRSPSKTTLYSSMISWAVWVFLLVAEVVVAVVFLMYFDELHLLYHLGAQQGGQILLDHNEFNRVLLAVFRIAHGHATDSFGLKCSFIPHLQHTFRWLYVIFVDIFTWQYINCCATINVECPIKFYQTLVALVSTDKQFAAFCVATRIQR